MPRLGPLSLIALAVAFNLPYARLAVAFDYPAILRRPGVEVLAAFAAGGPGLVLTWHAFALAALLFVPVSMAHALDGGRVRRVPALAVAAAIAGALAGMTQGMGLLRWVMVVPEFARSGDVAGFAAFHAFAGVAIGEHLGMTLTALHVGVMAAIQRAEGRAEAWLGVVTAILILGGAQEGVALAVGLPGDAFGVMAVAGYLALTVWMIASGVGLLRRPG